MNLNEMSKNDIRQAVAAKYGQVAANPDGNFEFPTGRNFALEVGYPAGHLDQLPADSIRAFAGVSNTVLSAPLKLGDTILDTGCGAGMDSFFAALKVGSAGKVYGIDSSGEMIKLAQESQAAARLENIEFLQGVVEELPFTDQYFDAVISNGIFNLVPDKPSAMKEISRVLKPNGTLILSEIVVKEDIPPEERNDLSAWFR